MTTNPDPTFQFDVALSFAGEDREYVDKIADRLRTHGVNIFYDRYEQAALWGKDLYEHLDHVYQRAARYCVLFVSEHYASKVWTNHERKSAQARALHENEEYILPVRFDDTEIPGLRSAVGYIDARTTTPDQLVNLVLQKIQRPSEQTAARTPFVRLGLLRSSVNYSHSGHPPGNTCISAVSWREARMLSNQNGETTKFAKSVDPVEH